MQFRTILLTTPVSSVASSESSCVSSRDFFEDPTIYLDPLEITERRNTVSSEVSSNISDTEKKNEKNTPENVEEKPAKKKGRPRTKGVVETKSVKKIEETDNFGITIDQLQEHLDNAISMSIVE